MGSPVLPEVYWISAIEFWAGRQGLLDSSRARQLLHRLDMTQILGQPQHQLANGADFGPDNEKTRAGIPQYSGLPPQMILDVCSPEWGINGNGHAPCIEHPKERLKERGLGRQHDGHAIAGRQPLLDQPGSYAATLPIEFGIGDRLFLILALP